MNGSVKTLLLLAISMVYISIGRGELQNNLFCRIPSARYRTQSRAADCAHFVIYAISRNNHVVVVFTGHESQRQVLNESCGEFLK